MESSLNTTISSMSTRKSLSSSLRKEMQSPSDKNSTLSSKKRKQEKRSPFGILSPNQIHINKSFRSKKSVRDQEFSFSVLPDEVDESLQSMEKRKESSSKFVSTDMKCDGAEVGDSGREENKGELQLLRNEIPTEVEVAEVQANYSEEKESGKNNLEKREVSEGCTPLQNALNLFVTSRKKREIDFTSTDGEDGNTTFSTLEDAELANEDRIDYQNESVSMDHETENMDLCSTSSNESPPNEKEEKRESVPHEPIQYERPPPYQYPEVQCPNANILREFYNMSLANCANSPDSDKDTSHQLQLSWSKSGILSLDEVILPALGQEEMNTLKTQQAKAKRFQKNLISNVASSSANTVHKNPLFTHDNIIEECRKILNQCVLSACRAARISRIERETEMKQKIKKKRKQEKEERKRKRDEKRKALLHAKAVKKEKRRREYKKNLPKNLENWREVAKLMTELAKIQKDQQIWNDAKQSLLKRQKETEGRESSSMPLQINVEDDDSNHVPKNIEVEVKNTIKDITFAANRINHVMVNVAKEIEKADQVQKGLYEKFIADHQFDGYDGVKNPRALIQVLTMND